jgi:rod shape determining protein RodA
MSCSAPPARRWRPVLWHFMHDYQRARVLTFLNPNPIRSAPATTSSSRRSRSGPGAIRQGLGNGTQAQLEFLPERSTDFIFAVLGEEFGLLGQVLLLLGYLFLIGRGLYIAAGAGHVHPAARRQHQPDVLRLRVRQYRHGHRPAAGGRRAVAAVSYGGTSMVTLMAGFGILMSINGHRNLLAR